jgi:hypothetical protein
VAYGRYGGEESVMVEKPEENRPLENLGADWSFVFFSFSSIFSLSKKMCAFLAVFTDFSRLRLKFTSEVVLRGVD